MNVFENQAEPFKNYGKDWQISGSDREILGELHKVIRCWLPCFNSVDDVEKVCTALRSIEKLAKDGTPPNYCEILAMRRSVNVGGLSAEITLTEGGISLCCTEYVWIGSQGFDHGNPTNEVGCPINLGLAPMGSFDKEMFEAWWAIAMGLAPEGPNDFSSVAEISSE